MTIDTFLKMLQFCILNLIIEVSRILIKQYAG
uniref:Uncharacterized protein n=1 Tax=Phyllymenia taiwanensis TaxID=1260292 RepID=R9XXT8_9FLOR|nr:hypothetical protein [Grateloupia taiwanensis]AGO19799.1 hypothetical protein [Grateloupia taiwanensis]